MCNCRGAAAQTGLFLGRARRPPRRLLHLRVQPGCQRRRLAGALGARLFLGLRLPVLPDLRAVHLFPGDAAGALSGNGLPAGGGDAFRRCDPGIGAGDVWLRPFVAGPQRGAGGGGGLRLHPVPAGGGLRARQPGRVCRADLAATDPVGRAQRFRVDAAQQWPVDPVADRRNRAGLWRLDAHQQPSGADLHAASGDLCADSAAEPVERGAAYPPVVQRVLLPAHRQHDPRQRGAAGGFAVGPADQRVFLASGTGRGVVGQPGAVVRRLLQPGAAFRLPAPVVRAGLGIWH